MWTKLGKRKTQKSKSRRRQSTRRLLIEPLEKRRLLTTWTVNDLGDGPIVEDGMLTLREALQAAGQDEKAGDAVAGSDQDIIRFSDRLFSGGGTQSIFLNSELFLNGGNGSLRIEGPGSTGEGDQRTWQLSINAQGNSAIFDSQDHVTIKGVELTGSDADSAIETLRSKSVLTLEDVSLSNNAGLGIHHQAGSLIIRNSVLSDNHAASSNDVFRDGGAILIRPTGSSIATAQIIDTTIQGNRADRDGGGIANLGGQLLVLRSDISDNTASGRGGGLFASDEAKISIDETSVNGNQSVSGSGGGVFTVDSDLLIGESNIDGNTAALDGGGIAIAGSTVTVTISGTTVSGNAATTGAGIDNAGGDLHVLGSTIAGNESLQNGGGIAMRGNSPTAVIAGSTLSGNEAFEMGGGLWQESGSLTMTNATVVLNRSNADRSGNGLGGGLALGDGPAAKLLNTIVAGNVNMPGGVAEDHAGQPSDIQLISGGTIDLGNSLHNLIGDPNSAGGLVNDPLQQAASNLVGNITDDGLRTVWDIDRILFTRLADNLGGRTPVHALKVDSPAIDAGSFFRPSAGSDPLAQAFIDPASRMASDQRGYPFVRADTRPLSSFRGPANGAIEQPTQPYLFWQPVEGATSYRLLISTSEDALPAGADDVVSSASIIHDQTVSAANLAVAANLLQSDSTYFWQFNAIDGASGESSNWSRTHRFTTSTAALPPGVPRPIRDQDEERFFPVDIGAFEVQQRPLFTSQELVVSTLVDESDGDYSAGNLSLREAVEIANLRSDRNSIRFASSLIAADGTDTTLTINSPLKINWDLTLSGPGADLLAISGGDTTRILEIGPVANVDITGMTFQQGRGDLQQNVDFGVFTIDVAGGAIFNAGHTTMADVVMEDNNSVSVSNSVNAGGGAINNIGSMKIWNAILGGNTALGNGGAIQNNGGVIDIGPDVSIVRNTAGEGGGIYTTGNITIVDSNIGINEATADDGHGGGIYVAAASAMVEMRRSTIFLNSVSSKSRDSAGFGGGIASIGSLHLFDTTIGGSDSGANFVRNAGILDTGVDGDAGDAYGGGLYLNPQNGASVVIERTTVSHNFVDGGDRAHGGGVYVAAGAPTHDSLGASELRIISSTISTNMAQSNTEALGGGVFVAKEWQGATPEMIDTTIAFNTADRGRNSGDVSEGAGIFADGRVDLGNSIVSNNCATEDRSGCDGSEIFNNRSNASFPSLTTEGDVRVASKILVLDGSVGGSNLRHSGGNGNGIGSSSSFVVTTDPQLGTLELRNGGFTATHKLGGAFNDAIDAGERLSLVDQRGFPVTNIVEIADKGGIADIGAYESSDQVRLENFSNDIRGANQFGSGDAFIAGIGIDDGRTDSLIPQEPGFLGLEFDIDPTRIGPGIAEGTGLGDYWGAEVTADVDGRIGIEYGYYVNSGSVDTFYNGLFGYSIDDSAGNSQYNISTGATFTDGQFFTTSPRISAFADLVFELNAVLKGEACVVGCADFELPINIDASMQLFSINRQLEVEHNGEMVPAFHQRMGSNLLFDADGNKVLTHVSDDGLNPPAFNGDIQFGDQPISNWIEEAAEDAGEEVFDRILEARAEGRKAEVELESGKDENGKPLSAQERTARANTRDEAIQKEKKNSQKAKGGIDNCYGEIFVACLSEAQGDVLGAEVEFGVGAAVGEVSGKLKLGSVAVTVPDIQLADSEFDTDSGKLSASTDDFEFGSEQDAKRQIAKVQIDAAALLGIRFGYPLGSYEASFGPIDIEATTVSYNVGPQFSITQDVEVEPFFDADHQASFMFVGDVIDGEVVGNFSGTIDVRVGDGPTRSISSGQSVSFTPGANLSIDTKGKDVDIIPSLKVGNRFSNDIGLDLDIVGLLEVLRLKLNAFGEEIFDIGPLYENEHSILEALGIGPLELLSIFDETFNLPAKEVTLQDTKDRDGDQNTTEALVISLGPNAQLPETPKDGKSPGGAFPLVSGQLFQLIAPNPVFVSLPLVDTNGVVGTTVSSRSDITYIIPPYNGLSLELTDSMGDVTEFEIGVEGAEIPDGTREWRLKGFENLIDSQAIFGVIFGPLSNNLLEVSIETEGTLPELSLVYDASSDSPDLLGDNPDRRVTADTQRAAQSQTNAFVVDNDLAFDIDNNGIVSLATDGLLLSRFFEFKLGDDLIGGAIAADSRRRDPSISHAQEIDNYILDELVRTDRMDVDGSRTIDPFVDGVLILRHMAGIGRSTTSGPGLTDGLTIPDGASRRMPDEIAAFIDGRDIPDISSTAGDLVGKGSVRTESLAQRMLQNDDTIPAGASPWLPLTTAFASGSGTFPLAGFGDPQDYEELYLLRRDGVTRDLIRTSVKGAPGRGIDFIGGLPDELRSELTSLIRTPQSDQFDVLAERTQLEIESRTLGVDEPIFLQLPYEIGDELDADGTRLPTVGGYQVSIPGGHTITRIELDSSLGGNALLDRSAENEGSDVDFDLFIPGSGLPSIPVNIGVGLDLPAGTTSFELFPRGLNDSTLFNSENRSQPDLDVVIGLVVAGSTETTPAVTVDLYSDRDRTPSTLSRTLIVETRPRQIVTLDASSTQLALFEQFTVDVNYRVADAGVQTPSVVMIEIHYDSTLVKFDGIVDNNLVTGGLVNSDTGIGPEDVETVSDGDLSTDKVIVLSWLDTSPDPAFGLLAPWLERNTPTETLLATIKFQALTTASETDLNVTGEPAVGFDLQVSPLTLDIEDVPLIVSTISDVDDGDLSAGNVSLREAIRIANVDPRPNLIAFDPILFAGGARTISLTGGELLVSDTIDIQGPGAGRLTIDAGGQSRIFNINDSVDSLSSAVQIAGLTLTGGLADDGVGGGAIFSLEDLVLNQVVVTDNHSDSFGGGVQSGELSTTANGTRLRVNQSTFSQNSAADGGGVYSFGAMLEISRSTFNRNRADVDEGDGGAVFNHDGDATIINSTFVGNVANKGGGAIWHWEIGDVLITSSTFAGNSSDADKDGSGAGGAINANQAQTPLTAHNTIFAGNRNSDAEDEITGQLSSASSHNLIATGNLQRVGGLVDTVNGNLVGADWTTVVENDGINPLLRDNGGLTQTVALLLDGPAVDAGNNEDALDEVLNPLTSDQRGGSFARIRGNSVDIGAFESTISPSVAVNVVQGSLSDAANSSSVTFEFSEAVTGFNIDDVTAVGGSLSGFAAIDADSFTATFTADDDAEISGSVTVGTGFQNLAGSLGIGGTDSVSIDTHNPTVSVTFDDTSILAGGSTTARFTFSELPVGFDNTDVTVTGGNLAAITQINGTNVFTATFTADSGFNGSGQVNVAPTYTDAAGNAGTAAAASLTVRNPGVTVSSISNNTTEAGGTATFTVVLNSQPTAEVTVGLTSSDTTEGTIPITALTFTTANWNVSQTVTVTGVDDSDDDGDIVFTIVTATASGGDYEGVGVNDVSVTNVDDDETIVVPTVVVDIVQGSLNDATNSSSVTFEFSEAVTGFDIDDVTVVGGSLSSFTAIDADSFTATFTADDDAEISGSVTVGAGFQNVAGIPGIGGIGSVSVDTRNPTVSIAFDNTSILAGGSTTAQFTFSELPIGFDNTDVTVTGGNLTAITQVNGTNVFTATFTADSGFNGSGQVNVATTYTDAAGNAGTAAAGILTVRNPDVTVSSISNNTTEAGGTATFTVVLNSQPTAEVTIGLTSSDTTEGTIPITALTFTTANWNVSQTVTVTGVDDSDDDGDVVFTIITATASGGDYEGIGVNDVGVTNLDDDDATGFTLSTEATTVSESGSTDSFTVVLDVQPLSNVVFDITSADTGEATVAPASLTFTPSNWNTAQTVTTTGVDDSIVDGTRQTAITVSINEAASDNAFDALTDKTVFVSTTDNDVQPFDPDVSIELEITDLDGNPIVGNEVAIGDEFRLSAIVTDLRRFGAAEGVFAAHLDVEYTNPTAFSVIASERQRLVFMPETTGGSFWVTFQGTTAPPITFSSDIESVADDLREALETHPDIGDGNVRVVGYEKLGSPELEIIFINDLAEMDLPAVQVDWSGLVASSGSPMVTVQTIANADRTEANWFRDAFTPGPLFPSRFQAEEGDGNDPNVFSDVGSGTGSIVEQSGSPRDSQLLWSVDLRASATGAIDFMGGPAEIPNGESVVLFGLDPGELVDPTDDVIYGSTRITIVDLLAPVLTAPANVSVQANVPSGAESTLNAIVDFLASASATDGADPNPVVTASNLPSVLPIGDTTVTFTATDASGNSSTAMATITVTNASPPQVTAPADINVEGDITGGASATLQSIVDFLAAGTATDTVDGNLSVTVTPPSSFVLGSHTVTFTATNNAGVSNAATATVTVVDTMNPFIVGPSNITLEATSPSGTLATDTAIVNFLAAATTTDVVDSTPAITNNAPANFAVGTTTVTFTATDDSGNESTTTATVTIQNPVNDNQLLPGETQVTLEGGNVVTRNNGNVILEVSRDSVTEVVFQGGEQDETLALDELELRNDAAVFIGFDGSGGIDTFRLLGEAQTLDLSSVATVSLQNVEFIDISGSGGNSLKMSESDIASLPDDGQTLHVMMNMDDTLEISGGDFKIDDTLVVDGQFYVEAVSATGASIRVGGLGLTNPLERLDVSADGSVTELDAIRLINALNSGDFFVPGSNGTLIDPEALIGALDLSFVDVTGDGELTLVDALRVINHLNDRRAGSEPLRELVDTSLVSNPVSVDSDSLRQSGASSLLQRDPIETLSGTIEKLVSVPADAPAWDAVTQIIGEQDSMSSKDERLNALDEVLAEFV